MTASPVVIREARSEKREARSGLFGGLLGVEPPSFDKSSLLLRLSDDMLDVTGYRSSFWVGALSTALVAFLPAYGCQTTC